MHIDYRESLAGLLGPLALPQGSILVLHVRLKGLLQASSGSNQNSISIDYRKLSTDLMAVLNDLYQPQGILVPTFTYSFTKTGIYDRTSTPGEVGRFGEEIRLSYPARARTMNPVFNFIDCDDILKSRERCEYTAFGRDSVWRHLMDSGHICLNINVPELFGTYLHYLEAHQAVPYRYPKLFPGRVSADGHSWKAVNYEYYVRDMDRDTRWHRDKIATFLNAHGVLHDFGTVQAPLRWFHSTNMDEVLGRALRHDPEFLISDAPPRVNEMNNAGSY